jgi:nicotinate-nucleotide adenylyltransferase
MLHPRSGPAFSNLRIGLLGGSFNPAHEGHRAMSVYALKRMGLDQVWWLVSLQNPLKPAQGMAPLEQRLREAQNVARHPKIIVTAVEAEFGTRYTADTLRVLKKRFPHARFVWLMGADNLRQMPRWRDWPEIFRRVPVAVFRRPAYAAGRGLGKAAQRFRRNWRPAKHGKILARQKPPAWLVMDNAFNTLSATGIRKEIPTWQNPKRK